MTFYGSGASTVQYRTEQYSFSRSLELFVSHHAFFSDYHNVALDAAIEMKLLPYLTGRQEHTPALINLLPASPIRRNRFTVAFAIGKMGTC